MKRYSHTIYSFIIYLIFLCVVPSAFSQSPSREYKLKTGVIYNLSKFVEFSGLYGDESVSEFTVCVLGKDPFGHEIDILQKKMIQGKPVKIKRTTNLEDVSCCHILFISESEEARMDSIVEHIKGNNILTISDMKGFAEKGGMIHLVTEKNRLRFYVNLKTVRSSQLKLSAHFLKLATIVDE